MKRMILLAAFIPALLFIAGAAASPAPASRRADRVVVLKREHKLQLFAAGSAFKTYSVALGRGGLQPKRQQGDGRTPEGKYVIDRRNEHSQFHRSLHISYPDASDRKRARALGVSPGGDIFIHGLPNGQGWIGAAHRKMDWTDGCIAVTNEEIEEIWGLVPNGTPIEIRP